jgi:hypothetical protein
MDPVVGSVHREERLPEIAQGWVGGGPGVLFGQHDPYGSFIFVDHLAVADLVLHPAEAMHAVSVASDA